MNTTQNEDRVYWHVFVDRVGEKFFLRRKKGAKKIEITQYLI